MIACKGVRNEPSISTGLILCYVISANSHPIFCKRIIKYAQSERFSEIIANFAADF